MQILLALQQYVCVIDKLYETLRYKRFVVLSQKNTIENENIKN